MTPTRPSSTVALPVTVKRACSVSCTQPSFLIFNRHWLNSVFLQQPAERILQLHVRRKRLAQHVCQRKLSEYRISKPLLTTFPSRTPTSQPWHLTPAPRPATTSTPLSGEAAST